MNLLKVSSKTINTTVSIGRQSSIFGLIRKIHSSAVPSNKSYYEILRIPLDASQSEIKEAYYKLSKMYHPDIKKDESSLAIFRSITEAYDILGNIKSRQLYDKKMYGKGEDYDTSKHKFYSSLYRDKIRDNIRAPNFEEILNKKAKLEQYLENEYRDRLAEIRISKKRQYTAEVNLWGEYGRERFLILLTFAASIAYYKLYIEEEYKIGS